ncbi:MAG: ASKHA domain-containing protein [Clostridia bacterium]|nr:ASKHA domain-containing protein [Clostridia bacterium]
MSEQLITVTFLPSGSSIRVSPGTNLMKAANLAGVQVNAVCGGKGSCGKCRAKFVEGVLSEASLTEKEFVAPADENQGWLLLCQRQALSDVTVDTGQVTEKPGGFTPTKGAFAELTTDVDPPVTKTYHQLAKPSISDQVADLDRILGQLPPGITPDINIVAKVPDLVREAGYQITSVVVDNELITLEKGNTTPELYGIAVDIGTTTVAGYLVDLRKGKVILSASATNRQRTYGADVISRITYTVENPGGLRDTKQAVVQTIDAVVQELLDKRGVSRNCIYVLTLIGNTVMSHLLLGVSPVGVASAPFIPAFSRGLKGNTDFLGLNNLPPYTRFFLLPNVAGYVGSDTVGVMLSTGIYQGSGTVLAVDIGTNGEIVLGSGNRMLTCSTAAGPAFEGACISQGMRAEPGAISKVAIDDDVRLEVIGGAEPVGICGSGLLDAVSELIRLGVLKGNGRIKAPADCPPDLPEAVQSRIRQTDKGYRFVLAEGVQEVAITQKDINELQLAKGAIRAGIDVLLDEMGLTYSGIDEILLAGAFGSNLRPESLKGIGMLPDIDLGRIKAVGNAAGAGAVRALLSRKQLELATELAQKAEHVELSLNQDFNREFARAIFFEVRS